MNISDALIGSASMIAKETVRNLKYDITVVMQINGEYRKDGGFYSITNGSQNFVGYTSDSTLKKGDTVYVSIPMGDYGQKKFILGRKEDQGTFDAILVGLSMAEQKNFDIKNKSGDNTGWNQSGLLGDFKIPESTKFNKINIECAFKTSAGNNIKDAYYGIHVNIGNTSTPKIYEARFYSNTDNFVGDPTNNFIFFNQSAVFSIENFSVGNGPWTGEVCFIWVTKSESSLGTVSIKDLKVTLGN